MANNFNSVCQECFIATSSQMAMPSYQFSSKDRSILVEYFEAGAGGMTLRAIPLSRGFYASRFP